MAHKQAGSCAAFLQCFAASRHATLGGRNPTEADWQPSSSLRAMHPRVLTVLLSVDSPQPSGHHLLIDAVFFCPVQEERETLREQLCAVPADADPTNIAINVAKVSRAGFGWAVVACSLDCSWGL
jgi:hypothetical protein